VELTNDEFYTLAYLKYTRSSYCSDILLNKHIYTDSRILKGPVKTLIEKSLVGQSFAWELVTNCAQETCYFIACTQRGEEELSKNLLRLALALADMIEEIQPIPKETVNLSDFIKIITLLSKEQLPSLLCHKHRFVRKVTRKRLEQLLNLSTPNS
jgi:hypothetical protein